MVGGLDKGSRAGWLALRESRAEPTAEQAQSLIGAGLYVGTKFEHQEGFTTHVPSDVLRFLDEQATDTERARKAT